MLLAVITALTLATEAPHANQGPATLESARVAADLRRFGYTIRDSAGMHGQLVLVLGAVHDSMIMGALLRGIDSLRTVFCLRRHRI